MNTIFLYSELGAICTDLGGAISPQGGNYIKCERANEFWCERSWFEVKCNKSCGVCGQGKML